MNTEFNSLQNHFLLAMPLLNNFNFPKAVVYVCAHSEEGAMGVVINRPINNVNLGEVMAQMNITLQNDAVKNMQVFLGGPIQPERGFIIHPVEKPWQSTLVTGPTLAVTSSQDILHAIAEGTGPHDFIAILGYAGWGADQLEEEVANNYWLTVPADMTILFNTSYENRWHAAGALIGVNMDNIASDAGHA